MVDQVGGAVLAKGNGKSIVGVSVARHPLCHDPLEVAKVDIRRVASRFGKTDRLGVRLEESLPMHQAQRLSG